MIIAIWVVTAVLVALWSAAAWGLHALMGWPLTWADPWVTWIEELPGASWLEYWMPGWKETVLALADGAQWLFGWLSGAAPALMWVLWGLGTAAMVTTSLVLTLLVVLLRERPPVPGGGTGAS